MTLVNCTVVFGMFTALPRAEAPPSVALLTIPSPKPVVVPVSGTRNPAKRLVALLPLKNTPTVSPPEDLPADQALEPGLIDRFGAEPGDEVVEIRPGRNLAEVAVERWRVNEALAA